MLEFLGTAVSVGYVAGPVVGVSVAATTAILGQFQNWGLSPSAIAQGLYNAQVQASGNFDAFKIWTRVTYKPCELTTCCFGLCSRKDWGQVKISPWEECGIEADNSLGPYGQSDFIYQGYQNAVSKGARCLAAHIARFAQ